MKKSALYLTALCSFSAATVCAQEEITNEAGIQFVSVPAGQFLMGSAENDAPDREKPQHLEVIEKPFYIGKFEVTQAQWQSVMGESAYELDKANPCYRLPGMKEKVLGDNKPATVSWNDAQNFIQKLNEKDPHFTYRLPTEAEWEYVARAGSTGKFFFGDDESQLGEYAWFGKDLSNGRTHDVGERKANPWGLYDIYGNVWEWVNDDYRPDYASAPTNKKTVRGGGWHLKSQHWDSVWRKPADADYRSVGIGFRLVAEKR